MKSQSTLPWFRIRASTISCMERRKSSYGLGEYARTATLSSGSVTSLVWSLVVVVESFRVVLVEVELEPASSDVVVILDRDSSISEPDKPGLMKNRWDPQRSGGGSINRGDPNKTVWLGFSPSWFALPLFPLLSISSSSFIYSDLKFSMRKRSTSDKVASLLLFLSSSLLFFPALSWLESMANERVLGCLHPERIQFLEDEKEFEGRWMCEEGGFLILVR